eukprot:1188442-Prorocentrum_minimum.AAC.1
MSTHRPPRGVTAPAAVNVGVYLYVYHEYTMSTHRPPRGVTALVRAQSRPRCRRGRRCGMRRSDPSNVRCPPPPGGSPPPRGWDPRRM